MPPVQGIKRTDTPKTIVIEVVTGVIRVIVERVSRWIVVIDLGRLISNDFLWFIVGDVHHLFVGWFDDDNVVFDVDVLLVV